MPDNRNWKTRKDPFDNNLLKDYGVVYQRAKKIGGHAANPIRLPNWPNPVNYMVDFQELACQDNWQAYLKFAVAELAFYGWSTFVPSPAEIVRDTFLGHYQCGFYFGPNFKSPLTIFLDEGGVEMIAEFARPFTKILFWWWLAESAYAAYQTFQTILHKQEYCPIDKGACLLSDGKDEVAGPNDSGTAFLYHKISDPDNMYDGAGDSISVPAGKWTATFACHFDARLGRSGSYNVKLLIDNVAFKTANFSLDGISQGKHKIVLLHFELFDTASVAVGWDCTGAPSLGLTFFWVDRFTISKQEH